MRYKVSFELVLDDNDPSVPDWVLDEVAKTLEFGEYIENFEVEQAN